MRQHLRFTRERIVPTMVAQKRFGGAARAANGSRPTPWLRLSSFAQVFLVRCETLNLAMRNAYAAAEGRSAESGGTREREH
jgi:hypothetical protein